MKANLLQRSIQKPKTKVSKVDPKVSFKDRVLENQLFESMDFISSVEKQRLYKPWTKTLIIKLIGKRMGYNILLTKIQKIWNTSDPLNLIDLDNDFYLKRFLSENLYTTFLNN